MNKIKFNTYDELFQQLTTATTLITPNRRLSASLHKHYFAYQQARNQTTWETPSILPDSVWIKQLWHQLASCHFQKLPVLLNSAQEQFIWETILGNDKESVQLLQLSETADMAQSAWKLLKQWRIDHQQAIFACSQDSLSLQRWANAFQTFCHQHHWIDAASLPDSVTRHIASGDIKPSQHILLLGFTELSPQLQTFLKTCQQAGSNIKQVELSQPHTECAYLALEDAEAEIALMARWAKALLEKQPQASIGCVLPALDSVRDRVWQLFSDVFADYPEHAFNISAGQSLSRYPIIHTALELLAMHQHTLSTQTLGYLLTSPFIGEADAEYIKRALFDRTLRKANINSVHLIEEQALIAKHCPSLAKRLTAFFSLLAEQPEKQSFEQWAHSFNQLLTSLGWPGERSLSSEEYQTVRSWLDLLNEFMTQDHVSPAVTYKQAFHMLLRITSKRSFQPESPDAPIQVLGQLEAAGLTFDHLWIAGMDDLTWPPQPKPNPFIPKSLQRELHMPHATAERELTFCRELTHQFQQSAPMVMFSYPEKNETLELQASPLIREMRQIHINDLTFADYQSASERIFNSREIETLIDDQAPALPPNASIHGGVSVLKQQALCPFKAFAEWRLNAHELESPTPGLRAKDRGTLLHKVLEMLWNQLHDHATLMQMEDEALSTLINQCINTAMEKEISNNKQAPQYLNLEKMRMHKLIWHWLLIEKSRPPFSVNTNEAAVKMTLGPLTLSVKVDRIDDIDAGKKLIIDYKTGKNNQVSHWFSDRPEDPQLPLYALIDKENTAGITYAQVNTAESLFKGINEYDLEIKGIKPFAEANQKDASDWNAQLTQWEQILTRLSHQFHEGAAKVDPKEGEQTCQWCSLKPLCRINEVLP